MSYRTYNCNLILYKFYQIYSNDNEAIGLFNAFEFLIKSNLNKTDKIKKNFKDKKYIRAKRLKKFYQKFPKVTVYSPKIINLLPLQIEIRDTLR